MCQLPNFAGLRRRAGRCCHRSQKIGHPVRSPVLKLRTGGLVLRWVTTWDYPLLHVLSLCCLQWHSVQPSHRSLSGWTVVGMPASHFVGRVG